ncbi:MAG: sulfite exporter TauE/SafE family protein [Rhodobacteraceae bacterium]|nr:sulfite exporter TauE/SafE family protein [Paracoccaceae bacterium]
MIFGMEPQIFAWVVAMLAVGGAAMGILAGLFGVGGGAIAVPILFELFAVLHIDDSVAMPLAVGTSLAIIVPTSIRSAWAHYRRGAVDLSVLRGWALPILAGVLGGAAIARYAAPWVFQLVFVVVASISIVKLLFGRVTWVVAQTMPKGPLLWTYGAVIGGLSALMGVGGGVLSTLCLTLHGRAIHPAVATSAGVGVLISVPGTVGYVLAGWGRAGLPPDAIGFVSLLGVALFVPATLLTAPLGVRMAHALPRRRMEVLFGLFLVTVCLRFLALLINGASG